MFWIKPRRKWGDYGDVLLHGEAYIAQEGHVAQIDTTVARICYPHSSVLLPAGCLLCTGEVLKNLIRIDDTVHFSRVWLERLIQLPLGDWLSSGQPHYPASGKPEDYFNEHEDMSEFLAGLGNDLFELLPHAKITIEADPPVDAKKPQIVPRLSRAGINKCDLAVGKIKQSSTIGPFFCSTRYAEVFDALECDNFELIKME